MGKTDLAYLRRRQADAAVAIDQLPGRPVADPGRMLVQTVPATAPAVYPTAVPAYFLTHPVTLGGAATEGSAGTQAVGSGSKYVYVLGPGVPPVGALLVARAVGGRWAAQYGTAGGPPMVHIEGCPCTESCATIYMVSSNPNSNNHILQSATLVYGPTPAGLLPLAIGESSYLSTTTFTDFSTGDQFYYYLSCYLGYYVLTRVYAVSLYGSPYRDATRYRWAAGYPGNSCSPFALNNGQVFSGGDPSCVVTISCTNPYG